MYTILYQFYYHSLLTPWIICIMLLATTTSLSWNMFSSINIWFHDAEVKIRGGKCPSKCASHTGSQLKFWKSHGPQVTRSPTITSLTWGHQPSPFFWGDEFGGFVFPTNLWFMATVFPSRVSTGIAAGRGGVSPYLKKSKQTFRHQESSNLTICWYWGIKKKIKKCSITEYFSNL